MSNNVALSTLTYAGVTLPLGGQDTFAEYAPDERYMTQKGLSSESFAKVPVQSGVITISYYDHDPISPILQGLINADDAAQGIGIQPGQMSTYNGKVVTWTNGRITQAGATSIELQNGVKTCTIRVTGVQVTHSGVAVGV